MITLYILTFKLWHDKPNCRISQFIKDSGEGKYTWFRTKKFSLDTTVSDELSYDDKKTSHAKKSDFAETDDRRIHTIRISDKLINMSSHN